MGIHLCYKWATKAQQIGYKAFELGLCVIGLLIDHSFGFSVCQSTTFFIFNIFLFLA
jgi:hypothetical protein